MSHSYVHNPVHVVFSTKGRRKLIRKESEGPLWAYLAGVCKKQKIFVHEIGGMEDHLHMLIQIPLTLAFSDAMQEIKTSSSRWMGRNFAWQRGFGVFGVSASNVEAVVRYIQMQEVLPTAMPWATLWSRLRRSGLQLAIIRHTHPALKGRRAIQFRRFAVLTHV
jgi:putative transposase